MDDEATLVGEPEDDEDDEGDDAIIAAFLDDDDTLEESQGSHQALLNKLMQTPPRVGALTIVLK